LQKDRQEQLDVENWPQRYDKILGAREQQLRCVRDVARTNIRRAVLDTQAAYSRTDQRAQQFRVAGSSNVLELEDAQQQISNLRQKRAQLQLDAHYLRGKLSTVDRNCAKQGWVWVLGHHDLHGRLAKRRWLVLGGGELRLLYGHKVLQAQARSLVEQRVLATGPTAQQLVPPDWAQHEAGEEQLAPPNQELAPPNQQLAPGLDGRLLSLELPVDDAITDLIVVETLLASGLLVNHQHIECMLEHEYSALEDMTQSTGTSTGVAGEEVQRSKQVKRGRGASLGGSDTGLLPMPFEHRLTIVLADSSSAAACGDLLGDRAELPSIQTPQKNAPCINPVSPGSQADGTDGSRGSPRSPIRRTLNLIFEADDLESMEAWRGALGCAALYSQRLHFWEEKAAKNMSELRTVNSQLAGWIKRAHLVAVVEADRQADADEAIGARHREEVRPHVFAHNSAHIKTHIQQPTKEA
jgi:hypothetical protein